MKQKNKILIILPLILFIVFLLWFFFDDIFKYIENKNIVETQKYTDIFLKESTDELNEQFKNNSTSTVIQRELGRRYLLDGKLDEAIKYFDLSKNEQSPQYFVDIGNVFKQKGDFIMAEKQYIRAIELNRVPIERELEIEVLIPDLSSDTLKFSTSTKKEIIKTVPNLVTPYMALASLYLDNLDRTMDAIKILEEGIKTNANYPDFYALFYDSYVKLGDMKSANLYRTQFDKLMES